jgi:hypothetical protein
MKKLLFAALLMISSAAFAQKDTTGLHIPMTNGSVVYEKIFDAPGKTKMQLFNSAQQWFIGRYKTDHSIEVTDTANIRVIGKGKELVVVRMMLNDIPFDDMMTIQVDCKDGKYRCRIYSMALQTDPSSKLDKMATNPEDLVNALTGKHSMTAFNKSQARTMLENVNFKVNEVMASLNKTMDDNF